MKLSKMGSELGSNFKACEILPEELKEEEKQKKEEEEEETLGISEWFGMGRKKGVPEEKKSLSVAKLHVTFLEAHLRFSSRP